MLEFPHGSPAITDACAGPLTLAQAHATILSVSCDEPEDATGSGDGFTQDDIVIASDGQSVQLRAERQGTGNGRMYTIRVEVQDPSGNKATTTCQVGVPHDQRPGHVIADDGVSYIVYRPLSKPIAAVDGAESEAQAVPTAFALRANWPNPFNPTSRLAYDVPQAAHVLLVVYNLLGQEVIRLVDAQQTPGWYEVTWDGRNGQGIAVASGVYLYRLTTSAGFSQTRRMTLLK